MRTVNNGISGLSADKTYLQKEMNLLPDHCRKRRERRLKQLTLAVVPLLLAACLAFLGLSLEQSIIRREAESTSLKSRIDSLTETRNSQILLSRISSRIDAKADAILTFEVSTPRISPLLNALESQLPGGMVLTSFEKTEKELRFSGRAVSRQSVAEYLHNLKTEPVFDSVVVLSITKGSEDGTGSSCLFTMQCRFTGKGGEAHAPF